MLTQADIRLIQRALQLRSREVVLGAGWQRLHREENIGVPIGRKLLLNEHDLTRLRELYDTATGSASLLTDWTVMDRLTLAEIVADEKRTSAAAFTRLQRVAAVNAPLRIQVEEGPDTIPCPPGLLLNVETHRLRLEWPHVRRVVIIENGAILERWWDLLDRFPEGHLDGALLIYRGHDQASAELLHRVQHMPPEIAVSVFPDLDPAGLVIARTIAYAVRETHPRRVDMIVPKDPECLRVSGANKPETHDRQRAQLETLHQDERLGDAFRHWVQRIERERWAVAQEAMLARQASLTTIPVFR